MQPLLLVQTMPSRGSVPLPGRVTLPAELPGLTQDELDRAIGEIAHRWHDEWNGEIRDCGSAVNHLWGAQDVIGDMPSDLRYAASRWLLDELLSKRFEQ
jgi:hypothetical protein